MMIEGHDTEAGNTLAFRCKNIDYDYQAEEIIQEIALGHFNVVKFILLDDLGERARWEKEIKGKEVTLVSRSERFTGEWRLNLSFTEEDHRRKYGN
jgi:hypothetical protein